VFAVVADVLAAGVADELPVVPAALAVEGVGGDAAACPEAAVREPPEAGDGAGVVDVGEPATPPAASGIAIAFKAAATDARSR
jgi:hypothetical protein